MKKTARFQLRLLIATPIFMILANFLAIFAHEYVHSLTAWLLGFKHHLVSIHFSGFKLLELPVIFNINSNVNYHLITLTGHKFCLGVIALTGIALANGGLYLLTLKLMKVEYIQRTRLLFYFIFWLNFMNLAVIFAYIPVQTFSSIGDIADIVNGFYMSPWLIFIFGGYAVTYMIWHFFKTTLPQTYEVLQLKSSKYQAALLMACAIPLFGYFGITGMIDHGEIAHFLSALTLFILPGVVTACWPKKKETAKKTRKKQRANVQSFVRKEPTLSPEMALTHPSIDEEHFIDNINTVLEQRDVKIRESQKIIKNKLTKTRK